MWILWLIAALCVAYYVIIVSYAGFATSFSIIWLVFAAVCILLVLGWDAYIREKERIPLWLPVSVITVCCTGILVFILVEILIFTGTAKKNTPNLDYVIVLGARVKEDGITRSLKKRLDKAIEYLNDNSGTILVLSGGKGWDEPVSEAEAMKEYLVFHGVREEQLILETRSFRTVENIAYSRVAIEEDQKQRKEENRKSKVVMEPGTYMEVPDKPVTIGVLTSNFHLFRSLWIGKKWGIPDIHGISCGSDPILFVHFCVRECVAILKDKLVGNM